MVLGEVSEAPYALFGGREAADGCAKWRAGQARATDVEVAARGDL